MSEPQHNSNSTDLPTDAAEIIQQEKEAFRALLAKIRGGDERAAWELLERFGPHIRAVVRRSLSEKLRAVYDSDDFVQSVWASFVRMQDDLEELDSPQRFVKLLGAMARNKVIDVARRARPNDGTKAAGAATNRSDVVRELRDHAGTPSQYTVAREQWERMVHKKSETVRTVLRLRMSGMKYTEIAAQVGINERVARRYVKTLLEEWERMGLVRGDEPPQDTGKLAG